MSFIAEFKCDACRVKVKAKYNGEHWLPPNGWAEILDTETVQTTNTHLCAKCRPHKKSSKSK